jgi:hypothetical protein
MKTKGKQFCFSFLCHFFLILVLTCTVSERDLGFQYNWFVSFISKWVFTFTRSSQFCFARGLTPPCGFIFCQTGTHCHSHDFTLISCNPFHGVWFYLILLCKNVV